METPIEPLVWKLPAHPGEPASGYASRLAALNGIDLATLMGSAGIRVDHVYSGREAGVRAVAVLGGLDRDGTDALIRSTPYRSTKHTPARIGGETLGWGRILSSSHRFCPLCIARDLVDAPLFVPVPARPWLRLEWMIEQLRSCRTHSVLLAETDPVYGRRQFADFSKSMEFEVLPRLDHLVATARPAGETAFEDWLRGRLNGITDPGSWLDGMPLHAGIITCEALGVEAALGDRGRIRDIGNLEWAAASLAGHGIAAGGEAGIERFLDGLVAKAQAAGCLGLKGTYGQIVAVLERAPDDPSYRPFRDVVRRHAIANLPFQSGTEVLGRVLGERQLHTVSSAAATYGTCRQTLLAIFARTGIAPVPGGPDHPRLTLRVDEFDDRLRAFAAGMRMAEVVAATGMPMRHLLEFVARGQIPTLFGSRSVNKARHRVARSEVDAFMDRLSDGAVPVDVPTARQVGFGRACFFAATNVGDLIELVLNNRLAWKGRLRGGRRYSDLLVDVDEVTRILQQDEPPRRSMTKMEVWNAMPGMNRAVVTALVEGGHIRMAAVKEFCPTTRRKLQLVSRDSFDAFRARYVTNSEIAQRHGMGPRMVIRLIAAAGRKPAFDRSKVLTWIYDQADVAGFPWSDERPKPVRKTPQKRRPKPGQCIAGPAGA